MTRIEKARNKLKTKPCLFCHDTRILCKGANECAYNGSTCNDTENCGEYDPAECPHCRDGAIAALLTHAPIPGLDPAVQAALVEYYMGGKPVEGWEWDEDLSDACECILIGFREGANFPYLCKLLDGMSTLSNTFNFSLTDPREAQKPEFDTRLGKLTDADAMRGNPKGGRVWVITETGDDPEVWALVFINNNTNSCLVAKEEGWMNDWALDKVRLATPVELIAAGIAPEEAGVRG